MMTVAQLDAGMGQSDVSFAVMEKKAHMSAAEKERARRGIHSPERTVPTIQVSAATTCLECCAA